MSLDEKRQRKQEIIYSTSMYDVLAQYGVTVKRRMCCCMFHQEKNPSMKVFRDGVQCFVCGKNWNVFDVVMQLTHCDFNTAFDLLGGNNQPSWQSYAVASRARKKREQEVELALSRNRLIKEQRTEVMALRELIKSEEPYSDLWCECQNKLVYSEYVLDQMMSEVSR